MKKIWGQTLSIDLKECAHDSLTDAIGVESLLRGLCKEIGMVPYGEPLVKRFGAGELEGISGIQFIETSSITIHCDEVDDRAFIDIFSCKTFDEKKAEEFCKKHFGAKESETRNYYRE